MHVHRAHTGARLTRPVSYFGLIRHNRPFRLLWLGTVVSFLGDWLTTVAVLTLVTELASDSSLTVAAVLIAKTLPIFLVSPWAGPLADRLDRRRLLILTDLLRAALVVGMVVFYQLGNLTGVLATLTLRTAVGGFFIPARTAAIPDVAKGPELPVAMALNGGTWSVTLAAGAAIGGALTSSLGVTGALFVDAGTFLLSAALLWGLPPLPPRPSTEPGDPGFLEGLRHLRGRIYLPTLLLLKAALSLAGASLVVIPIYAGGLFPGYRGPFYIGILYAARGIGALIGSMGMRKVLGDEPTRLRAAIAPAFLLLATAYLAMGLAPTFPVAATAYAVGMVGSGMVWTFAGTLGQLATERSFRGRLFAMEFAMVMLVSAATSLVAGAALDHGLSPRELLLGVGALYLLPAAVWAAVLRWAPDVQP